jgi:hypothetical protein
MAEKKTHLLRINEADQGRLAFPALSWLASVRTNPKFHEVLIDPYHQPVVG